MEWTDDFVGFKTDRRPLTLGNCQNCDVKFTGLNIQFAKHRSVNDSCKLYCEKCFAGSPQVMNILTGISISENHFSYWVLSR